MIYVKVNHVIYQIQTMPKQKRASSAHLAPLRVKLRRGKETKEKIPLRDSESRNETQPLEDNFELTTQKEGYVIQQVIDKLANRI